MAYRELLRAGSESSFQAGAVMSCLMQFSKNFPAIVSDISIQDVFFVDQDTLGKYYFFSLFSLSPLFHKCGCFFWLRESFCN